jgi:hypothetical protein
MEFDGQSKFVGARQGYEYRTAEQGTGYYKRSAPAPAEPAPRAKVSKPGGSDGPVPGMQPPLVRCAGWQQLWLSRSLSRSDLALMHPAARVLPTAAPGYLCAVRLLHARHFHREAAATVADHAALLELRDLQPTTARFVQCTVTLDLHLRPWHASCEKLVWQ